MASTSGTSWVTSCVFAPVRITASGTPWASVMTWCLLPSFRRSVGFGPVCAPLKRLGPMRSRPPPVTSQVCRLRAVWLGAKHGASARRQLAAKRVGIASRSCRSRSPAPWAGSPTGCRSAARRRRPPAPAVVEGWAPAVRAWRSLGSNGAMSAHSASGRSGSAIRLGQPPSAPGRFVTPSNSRVTGRTTRSSGHHCRSTGRPANDHCQRSGDAGLHCSRRAEGLPSDASGHVSP
jgi:hypothetical protein